MSPTLLTMALAGGILIGLAGAAMLLGIGRIAGISGILARATGLGSGTLPRPAAWLFLAGLPLGAAAMMAATGAATPALPDWRWQVAAGLLVGLGTRIGSGCTSGHGVCGAARLSARSLAATLTFMIVAMATVWLVRQGGWR